eukprot:TRINITY_DN1399_c0_g1_i2.p1 TRINITY_DN1399_c0_g1~~TRINITY_DN1399_c0_g1_i2.p1  ORF type:complete len:666 (+),score=132.47 TRINITY_DN1399_c0_g1_i2:14-2011(+)
MSGARSTSASSRPGSLNACEELKASVVRASQHEEERMKAILNEFACQQHDHLSSQLQKLQEALVTSLSANLQTALDLHGGQNQEVKISIPSAGDLNLFRENADDIDDAFSSDSLSVPEEGSHSKMLYVARSTSSPVHCVDSTAPPRFLEDARRFELQSSTMSGAFLWIPSKEAQAGTFNQLIENEKLKHELGNNMFLRKALHKRGIIKEPLDLNSKRFPCLLNLVHSRCFAYALVLLIALDAVFMFVLSDDAVHQAIEHHEATASGQSLPPAIVSMRTWERDVEITFTCLFTVELFLRMVANGCLFWFGPDWQWNCFEILIVFSMIIDTFLIVAGEHIENITYIRIFRILRTFRSFRLMRTIRFFRELRLMVSSTINSLVPLMWGMILLCLTISAFTVLFLQGVTSFILDATASASSIEAMLEYYDSFPMAFFSLFMAITGGDDWKNVMWPLLDISPFYGFLFMVYISLMVVGFMNIITGIFVESARERHKELSNNDHDLVAQAEQARLTSYIRELLKIFNELDKDKSGTISLDEFEAYTARCEIQALFSYLELDISKAAQLFRLLDVDGSNEIEVDAFVMGCMRMKGMAKGVDMESLMLQSKQLMKRWSKQHKWNRRRFANMEKTLADSQEEQTASLQRLETNLSSMMAKLEWQMKVGTVSERI